VNSRLTEEFIRCFRRLPERIQVQSRKSYKFWKENPQHPSLDFKRVSLKLPIYSVRVSIGWRALGQLKDDTIVWFWIGSHSDYDGLLKRIREESPDYTPPL